MKHQSQSRRDRGGPRTSWAMSASRNPARVLQRRVEPGRAWTGAEGEVEVEASSRSGAESRVCIDNVRRVGGVRGAEWAGGSLANAGRLGTAGVGTCVGGAGSAEGRRTGSAGLLDRLGGGLLPRAICLEIHSQSADTTTNARIAAMWFFEIHRMMSARSIRPPFAQSPDLLGSSASGCRPRGCACGNSP